MSPNQCSSQCLQLPQYSAEVSAQQDYFPCSYVKKLGIVAKAGSTCRPLPLSQPDHLPKSLDTLDTIVPFSLCALRPLARFIAGSRRRALVRRGFPQSQPSATSELSDLRSLSHFSTSSSRHPPSSNPIAPSPPSSTPSRDYAKLAAPLTDLTRSTVLFPTDLPPSAVDSFNQLKAALLSAPLLLIPYTVPDSTFILYTDASTLGLGAVLL
jgi:hypothetical protein